MPDKKTYNTDFWLNQLSKIQLPVLSGVMKDLNAVARSDAGSATQLADIIMRDAALSAKVLRIANSAYHNPNAENSIGTINRAVVQLGFTGIKAISLSVMLIDSLLKKESKTRTLEWMARAFHAAVQAESLIKKVAKAEDTEEVFITALLLHVGDLAFWSSRDPHVELLDNSLQPKSGSDAEIEKNVLGTSIKDISIGLVNEWHLGDELLQALVPTEQPSKATQAVLLGEEISLAAEKGWDSPEFRDVLVKVSQFSGLSLIDVRQLLMQGADKAVSVASSYGAVHICDYIPSTQQPKAEPAASKAELNADAQLQLDVLREMGLMVEKNVDVNTLFKLVIDGIHRGIGLERVALCLLDPRAGSMSAKYILGNKTDQWSEEMKFPVKSEQDNLFAYCLHARATVWLRRKKNHAFMHLINKKMTRLIDMDNCLVSAVYAGNRPIGIIVADRGNAGNDIIEEQLESFEHFTQQTSASLSLLATQRKKLTK